MEVTSKISVLVSEHTLDEIAAALKSLPPKSTEKESDCPRSLAQRRLEPGLCVHSAVRQALDHASSGERALIRLFDSVN